MASSITRPRRILLHFSRSAISRAPPSWHLFFTFQFVILVVELGRVSYANRPVTCLQLFNGKGGKKKKSPFSVPKLKRHNVCLSAVTFLGTVFDWYIQGSSLLASQVAFLPSVHVKIWHSCNMKSVISPVDGNKEETIRLTRMLVLTKTTAILLLIITPFPNHWSKKRNMKRAGKLRCSFDTRPAASQGTDL